MIKRIEDRGRTVFLSTEKQFVYADYQEDDNLISDGTHRSYEPSLAYFCFNVKSWREGEEISVQNPNNYSLPNHAIYIKDKLISYNTNSGKLFSYGTCFKKDTKNGFYNVFERLNNDRYAGFTKNSQTEGEFLRISISEK